MAVIRSDLSVLDSNTLHQFRNSTPIPSQKVQGNDTSLVSKVNSVTNYCIDDSASISLTNAFTGANSFSQQATFSHADGIKVNKIVPVNTNENVLIEISGSSKAYKGATAGTSTELLNQGEISTLINSASGAVTMIGADGVTAGTGGLTPSPGATDNVKYLRGDATYAAISTSEIASASKSGNDTTLVTGTAGGDGKIGQWNSDGDLVASTYSVNDIHKANRRHFNAKLFIDSPSGDNTVKLYPLTVGAVVYLYTNSVWLPYDVTSAISLSMPSTTDTNYDIFLYDNSGTLTLEHVAWSNNTTRATALAFQDRIYVKSGEANKRYVATVRTGSVSGQVVLTNGQHFIWNMYNDNYSLDIITVPTSTWTYNTASFRAVNNSTTVGETRHETVIGIAALENIVVRAYTYAFRGSAGISAAGVVAPGIGVNSTTVNSATGAGGFTSNNHVSLMDCVYRNAASLAVGYHYLQQLEFGEGGVTTTYYGGDVRTRMEIEYIREANQT